jgi:pimeloyl-ACP methyl ester carboxylesterase
MPELKQRTIEANGIRLHIAEQGEGPLVILCHGFPESWYSWRHQISALAQAGFHAVAPDMRGYGQSGCPEPIDQYSLLHLVGDMVGLVDALGVGTAVIAGHDWGAPVAWHAGQLRPDRFRGVIGLSVPFLPRGQAHPEKDLPRTDDAVFYQEYFQAPGVAEADLERDVRFSMRSTLYAFSGDAIPLEAIKAGVGSIGLVPRQGGILAGNTDPASLPAWLTEADVDIYTEEFSRTGYRGGLNWYRNIARNWQLLSPFEGVKVEVPALYIVGDRDLVLAFRGMDRVIRDLSRHVPKLRSTLVLPGCGHWTQQERPEDVNQAMIDFLRGL